MRHLADQADTRNRWAGRLQEASGSNIWSCSTKFLRRPSSWEFRDSHDTPGIGLSIAAACWIIRVYATPQSMFGLSDEPIHLPMIDVSTGVCCTMRPPMIEVLWVMIRLHALARRGIGNTHGGNTVGHWNAICPRISSEVGVERAIFLHNDDDMFDFVNATRGSWGCCRRCVSTCCYCHRCEKTAEGNR